jgi:alpha-ketoglutarate-dependent taurine dioxygenase
MLSITSGIFNNTVNSFLISELDRTSTIKANFGGKISGLQIKNILNSSSDLEQLNELLIQRKILIIEDQKDLSAEDLRRFSQYFGTLQIHKDVNSRHPTFEDVNVISNIKDPITNEYIGLHGADVEKFHTDLSW